MQPHVYSLPLVRSSLTSGKPYIVPMEGKIVYSKYISLKDHHEHNAYTLNFKLNSAPLCKNAVSAFQISCKLLPFTLEFLKKLADNHISSITKGSICYIKHVHTTFYHCSGLTRNWMSNGNIYYVL